MTRRTARLPSPIRARLEEGSSLEWVSSLLGIGHPISEDARVSKTDATALLGRIALRDGRTLLVPMGPAVTGIGSLRLYRPQKLGPRIWRTLLIVALRTGVARRVLQKARALVQGPSAGNRGDATFLLDSLREMFGHRDIVFGLHFGAPGPVRKPVVAIMTEGGDFLGFAKIGWNEQTVSLVENEKRCLEALALHPLKSGRFPTVLRYARWDGRCMLVTAPLPLHRGRREDRKLGPVHLQFLIEVAAISRARESFARSGFFSRLQGRLSHLTDVIPAGPASIPGKALDFLASTLGSADIPWVWRLGDFTPWNAGVEKGARRIACIDLEYAEKESIPGWDIFHFLSHAAGRNARGADVVSTAQRRCRAYFEALDIGPRLIPALYVAYLLDLYTLWARIWARHDGQLTPPAARALSRLIRLADQSMRTQEAQKP